MQVFLIIVILAVGLYSVATQIFKGASPADFFRVKYVGPLASSTAPRGITTQTPDKTYTVSPKTSSPQSAIVNVPKIQPPFGFTVEQLSPFYKKIYLAYIHAARSSNDASVFVLKPDFSLKENINITDWYIKVNSGATVKIPGAINDYNPLGAFAEKDIILDNAGHQINISSLPTPFGKNLRLNKCTGYLNNIYQFSPALPNQCPGVNRSDIVNFTGACQSFIFSLGACRIPTSNEINFYASNDNGCRDVLNSLNYGSCYNRYSQDIGFLGNEWRVWLGEKIPFDPQHDRVLLFDKNNLLVDEYIY